MSELRSRRKALDDMQARDLQQAIVFIHKTRLIIRNGCNLNHAHGCLIDAIDRITQSIGFEAAEIAKHDAHAEFKRDYLPLKKGKK